MSRRDSSPSIAGSPRRWPERRSLWARGWRVTPRRRSRYSTALAHGVDRDLRVAVVGHGDRDGVDVLAVVEFAVILVGGAFETPDLENAFRALQVARVHIAKRDALNFAPAAGLADDN